MWYPHVSPSEVLLRTAVTSLTSWYTITLRAVLWSLYLRYLLLLLLEVISLLGSAIVEIIEHQVHVLCLFHFQVVVNLFVPVNFNFDVNICLSRHGSRFVE